MASVDIIDFDAEFAADFERLNREWLEALFEVEPFDAQMLGDPETHLLEPGGHILLARSENRIIGTVALRNAGDRRYELTKMAVTAGAQGQGVGRALALAAIERFRAIEGRSLYLRSDTSLKAALTLYESVGFRPAEPDEPSEYQRCDIYMVFDG